MTIEEKCKEVLKRSFYASGMTEAEIADKMKISRRTIYNWIYGTSFPTFPQTIQWFIATRQRMMPWIAKMQYFEKDRKPQKLTEEQMNKDLIDFLDLLSPAQKARLHFIFCGEHGSSPDGILEMVSAHLHTPLVNRFQIASMIMLNYEMAEASKELILRDEAEPNIEVLRESVTKGRDAILQGFDSYIITKEEQQ